MRLMTRGALSCSPRHRTSYNSRNEGKILRLMTHGALCVSPFWKGMDSSGGDDAAQAAKDAARKAAKVGRCSLTLSNPR
jgi:hypothetical protein